MISYSINCSVVGNRYF